MVQRCGGGDSGNYWFGEGLVSRALRAHDPNSLTVFVRAEDSRGNRYLLILLDAQSVQRGAHHARGTIVFKRLLHRLLLAILAERAGQTAQSVVAATITSPVLRGPKRFLGPTLLRLAIRQLRQDGHWSPCRSSERRDSMPHKPHHDSIYQALPPLTSSSLRSHMETASEAELPAEVLARVFRALPPKHENSAAALTRLLGSYEQYPYMRAVRALAVERARWLSAAEAGADDLYQDAVLAIVKMLRLPRGQFAERSWIAFCKQRFEDAWRERFGRDGQRRDPPMTSLSTLPRDSDSPNVEIDVPTDGEIEWHGRVGPDKEGWLEDFIARRFGACRDENLRVVALDQFLGSPASPIDGPSHNGKQALTARLGLSRFQVMRLVRRAKVMLLEELRRQNECEIDLRRFESGN